MKKQLASKPENEAKSKVGEKVDVERQITALEKKMLEASDNLLFEEAARYRNEIKALMEKAKKP